MLSSSRARSSCHHEEEEEESSDIKQDEKFFTRIMSKETSMANSSCRVYYGGAAGSIPFTWESRPGTPKHILFNDSPNIPPLTPPPSYFSNSKSKSIHKNKKYKPKFFNINALPRLVMTSKKTVSPSSSVSSTSTSSSSWSSGSSNFHSSPSIFKNSPKSHNKNPCFVCLKSPITHYGVDDDDDDNDNDPSSSRLCFGGKADQALNVLRGCYLMDNMKNAFLSIVGHHGSGKANYKV